MEPKIVSRKSFTVVGMHYRGKNEQNEIPQMWQALGPRVPEIKHISNDKVAYGISDNMDPATGEFDYIAGFEVSRVEDLPAGMVNWEVPEGRYALFTTTLPTLGQTFKHAYHEWLPKSGYEHRPGPDFEIYDEEFDPGDPGAEFDIYVPIK
jgi:AraC family transcriptional regulator